MIENKQRSNCSRELHLLALGSDIVGVAVVPVKGRVRTLGVDNFGDPGVVFLVEELNLLVGVALGLLRVGQGRELLDQLIPESLSMELDIVNVQGSRHSTRRLVEGHLESESPRVILDLVAFGVRLVEMRTC